MQDFMNDKVRGAGYLDASSKELHDIHTSMRGSSIVGTEPLKVVIADDDCIFVEGVAALLNEWDEFSLVGKAMTLEEALAQCVEKNPAVVMMGATFRGVGCADTVRHIIEANPEIRIMIVASMGESGFVLDALRAGARGFGSRDDISSAELRALFWGVGCGDIAFSGSLGTALQGALISGAAKEGCESIASDYFESLDDRERTVLAALEEGLSNAEISRRLYLSEPP